MRTLALSLAVLGALVGVAGAICYPLVMGIVQGGDHVVSDGEAVPIFASLLALVVLWVGAALLFALGREG